MKLRKFVLYSLLVYNHRLYDYVLWSYPWAFVHMLVPANVRDMFSNQVSELVVTMEVDVHVRTDNQSVHKQAK
jgi:hypothetical protein